MIFWPNLMGATIAFCGFIICPSWESVPLGLSGLSARNNGSLKEQGSKILRCMEAHMRASDARTVVPKNRAGKQTGQGYQQGQDAGCGEVTNCHGGQQGPKQIVDKAGQWHSTFFRPLFCPGPVGPRPG